MNNVEMRAAWRRTLVGVASTALVAGGALTFATSAAAAGNTIFVNPGGFDSPNCGSAVQQCLTLQKGVDQAEAGDTVKVAPGTYTGPVLVTKALTLQADGDVVIDGTHAEYGPSNSALVTVHDPGGDVTIDGFTIENAPSTDTQDSQAVNYIDTAAADTLTFSHNHVSGDPSDTDPAANQIGLNSSDTAAHVIVRDSDFSGVFQGVLLEGVSGPVDVTGNVFSYLDTVTLGENVYPGEGVYILSDKGTAGTDQNIVGNTFRDYGGIGIAVSAGYDFGGCSDGVVCNGSVAGSISDNTFDLRANAGDVQASAIRLRAQYEDNALDLTIGGNTGGVAAPTATITESERDGGVITVTPGSRPNTIVPMPTPTLSVAPPATLTTAEPATEFTATATNPTAGNALTRARYDFAITHTSAITASQVKLEYDTGDGYATVPLTDAPDGTIVGSFGPTTGFAFPADGAPRVTDFRISVPDVDAPAGNLTVTTSLVEVSQSPGSPVLNTVTSDSGTITVVANSVPATPDVDVTVPFNSPGTAVTLAPTDADDDTLSVTHTNPSHGTVNGTGTDLSYVPDTGYAGTDSFTYTANDNLAGKSTGVVNITVAKAAATLGTATFNPAAPTSATAPTVTIPVTSAGVVDGGTVTVTTGSTVRTAKVANGKVTVPLVKYTGTLHRILATFGGTATTSPVSKTYSFTVTKAVSKQSVVLSPTRITGTTKNAKAIVTVSAGGATVDGGTVSISSSATPKIGSAKVVNGKATISLPQFSKAKHTWKFTYSGTAYAAASTYTYVFTSY